ncbi:hypothetical protein [Scytonema sp. NUACC26]|uniref:hypothetical protein n=1 Tax=Scytonema sp. NUACC26 TaxID=3140176 RepID=UPI0034DB9D76
MKLRKQPCKSCPFFCDGLKLDPDYMMKVYSYLAEGTNHICHSGNQHICYGGRQWQLNVFCSQGLIEAPTNESLFEAMRKQGIEPTHKDYE